MSVKHFLPIICLLSTAVSATQFNGRISVSGSMAQAHQGDIGQQSSVDILNADQQGIRLMLNNTAGNTQWSLHLNTFRLHLKGVPASANHSSDLFRFYDISHHWLDERDDNSVTQMGYELDHAFLKHGWGDFNLTLGRQPVDWGSGRFWQPMNVFGAFAPTALDTEYKPGIDAAVVNFYPSAFSSLEAVYAFAPHDSDDIENSGALYYRRPAGKNSEMALLAGRVIDNTVYGASFESDWKGAGWRVEGVHYAPGQSREGEFFWIAGLDYQFQDGTLITAEVYNNALGASHESSLVTNRLNPLHKFGLLQHISQRILGLSANRDITPLLKASYSLLTGTLKNGSGRHKYSALHQLNFNYSISNESELIFSLQHASGRGLDEQNNPGSEFGHLPDALTLIYRHYF